MLRGLALATVHVSTATTTTSGYSKEVVKNKQGSLDCLQQTGVQPASAKRPFVTETTGAEKDSATVTETEDVEMCDVSSAKGDTEGCPHGQAREPKYLQTSCPLSRLCARGLFSGLQLPAHYDKKPQSLPLYGLRALVYGLH